MTTGHFHRPPVHEEITFVGPVLLGEELILNDIMKTLLLSLCTFVVMFALMFTGVLMCADMTESKPKIKDAPNATAKQRAEPTVAEKLKIREAEIKAISDHQKLQEFMAGIRQQVQKIPEFKALSEKSASSVDEHNKALKDGEENCKCKLDPQTLQEKTEVPIVAKKEAPTKPKN